MVKQPPKTSNKAIKPSESPDEPKNKFKRLRRLNEELEVGSPSEQIIQDLEDYHEVK
jgi:hypothetical protein